MLSPSNQKNELPNNLADKQSAAAHTQTAYRWDFFYQTHQDMSSICWLYLRAYRLAYRQAYVRRVKNTAIISFRNIRLPLKVAISNYYLLRNGLNSIQDMLHNSKALEQEEKNAYFLTHALNSLTYFIQSAVLNNLDELLFIFGASGYMSSCDFSKIWLLLKQHISRLEVF